MTSRRNGRRSCQLLTYSYGRATQPLGRERPTQQSGSAFPVDVIMSVSSPTACEHTKKRPKKVTSCAEGTKCVCAPRSTCIFTPLCAPYAVYSFCLVCEKPISGSLQSPTSEDMGSCLVAPNVQQRRGETSAPSMWPLSLATLALGSRLSRLISVIRSWRS